MAVEFEIKTQRKKAPFSFILVTAYLALLLCGLIVMALLPSGYEQGEAAVSTGNAGAVGRSSLYTQALLLQQHSLRKAAYGRSPVQVKGIYLSAWAAGTPSRFNSLLELVETTPLNALVIDIKDATGWVTFDPGPDSLASRWGLVQNRIPTLEEQLELLHEKSIYAIARIVVCKDPQLVKVKPEWFLKRKDGSIWVDRGKKAWLDPYNREWWDYIIDISVAAARLGFDEIQFDYIRFPTDGSTRQIEYSQVGRDARIQAISDFLGYAREQLKPYGVFVSADVFGLVTTDTGDTGIGQNLEAIVEKVDYVCPMVYPSHYYAGSYGLDNPNAEPYWTVYYALNDACNRLKGQEGIAIIRPWLQDFSLGHPYGKDEVLAQIKAVYDAGFTEWLLWDPACRYTKEALKALK